MVHFVDLLPTVLALSGVRRPDGPALDGDDLADVLSGSAPATPPRRFWQWNLYEPVLATNAAARNGRWKLVRPSIGPFVPQTEADAAMVARHRRLEHDRVYEPHVIRAVLDERPHWRPVTPMPCELYDIETDPLEQTDLSAAHPELTAQLLDSLEMWWDEVERTRHRSAAPRPNGHRERPT